MRKLIYLISALILSLNYSCSNDDPVFANGFSTTLLKENEVTINNEEQTYVIECRDGGFLQANSYSATAGENRVDNGIIIERFIYEEDWFTIVVAEDFKKVTLHVKANTVTPEVERKIVIEVNRMSTASRFTLTQKK